MLDAVENADTSEVGLPAFICTQFISDWKCISSTCVINFLIFCFCCFLLKMAFVAHPYSYVAFVCSIFPIKPILIVGFLWYDLYLPIRTYSDGAVYSTCQISNQDRMETRFDLRSVI